MNEYAKKNTHTHTSALKVKKKISHLLSIDLINGSSWTLDKGRKKKFIFSLSFDIIFDWRGEVEKKWNCRSLFFLFAIRSNETSGQITLFRDFDIYPKIKWPTAIYFFIHSKTKMSFRSLFLKWPNQISICYSQFFTWIEI